MTVPPWRRGDVEREADLIEEVARLWGLDRFPATLPSRRGAVGRLAPEQRAAPARRGRARRRRPVRGGRLELHLARGGAPARPAGRRRRAREPDVRGPVGDAHDAARLAAGLAAAQHARAGSRTCACSSRRRLPAADRRAPQPTGNPWYPVARPGAAGRAHAPRRADDRAGAAGELGRRRAAARRLLRRQGRARGAAARAARRLARASRQPTGRSCIRAARASVLAGEAPAGWLGELHPSVAARLGPRRRRRLRARLRRRSPRPRRACRATRT